MIHLKNSPKMQEQKTIGEWYQALPPIIKKQANTNALYENTLNDNARSLRDAINNGFVWEDTPEGERYWNSVYIGIVNNEISETTDIPLPLIHSTQHNTTIYANKADA